jgi:hypothetical protein
LTGHAGETIRRAQPACGVGEITGGSVGGSNLARFGYGMVCSHAHCTHPGGATAHNVSFAVADHSSRGGEVELNCAFACSRKYGDGLRHSHRPEYSGMMPSG